MWAKVTLFPLPAQWSGASSRLAAARTAGSPSPWLGGLSCWEGQGVGTCRPAPQPRGLLLRPASGWIPLRGGGSLLLSPRRRHRGSARWALLRTQAPQWFPARRGKLRPLLCCCSSRRGVSENRCSFFSFPSWERGTSVSLFIQDFRFFQNSVNFPSL